MVIENKKLKSSPSTTNFINIKKIKEILTDLRCLNNCSGGNCPNKTKKSTCLNQHLEAKCQFRTQRCHNECRCINH